MRASPDVTTLLAMRTLAAMAALMLLLTACGSKPPAPPSALSSSSPPAAGSPSSAPPAPGQTPAPQASYGNPDGHAAVPAEARAEDTSHPTRVIGGGTPAS